MALRYLLPGQMKFMKEKGFDVLMVSADGPELGDVLNNESCRHIIVPMTRSITPLKDLQCLFKLIRIFKKEKPDIVHTHTPKAGLLGMMAAKFCGVKIRIHTVAGLPLMVESGLKYQLLKFTEKLTCRSANHVWPNSNSLMQFIADKKFAPPQKLKVIAKGSSNGIDVNRFSKSALDENVIAAVKTSINFSAANIYLLSIGRMVADKGIVELVNVFYLLQIKYPQLKLVLVGKHEPSLDPLPAATISQIESNAGIIHIDWSQQVEYYMAVASCFIFPSHREGFPNVLLQAGAMQLPIVCSRIAGNVDIVEHNSTGLIFESGNEEQMAEQIEYAINHPQEMKTMADKLVAVINKDYRRENVWQSIYEEYEGLLKG